MALFAVIRLALWLGIWWLLTQIQVGVMLAGVLAAVIAMLLSILFLDRLRSKVALRWKAADDRRRGAGARSTTRTPRPRTPTSIPTPMTTPSTAAPPRQGCGACRRRLDPRGGRWCRGHGREHGG